MLVLPGLLRLGLFHQCEESPWKLPSRCVEVRECRAEGNNEGENGSDRDRQRDCRQKETQELTPLARKVQILSFIPSPPPPVSGLHGRAGKRQTEGIRK